MCHRELTPEKKQAYLQRAKEAGVKNIEMESSAVASLCKLTGVKCAVVTNVCGSTSSHKSVEKASEMYVSMLSKNSLCTERVM